jgi:hypothetical protein
MNPKNIRIAGNEVTPEEQKYFYWRNISGLPISITFFVGPLRDPVTQAVLRSKTTETITFAAGEAVAIPKSRRDVNNAIHQCPPKDPTIVVGGMAPLTLQRVLADGVTPDPDAPKLHPSLRNYGEPMTAKPSRK